MRFILLTILSVLLVVFLGPIASFWVVMIGIGLLSALIFPNSFGAFMGGALGMGLGWVGLSIYIGLTTASPLPDRMGELMGLGSGMTLVAATGVLGFLLGGFSALSGVLFRKMIRPVPQNVYKG
ncbi:hypothetical protein DFQ04_1477 [Algoriphagus boseongensis]|uniref:Uncharacterized protein n=1 Tax=Algoriphagus boseongensis TaxID=1442587 RepID=A0A4R6TBN7_9BACT|nr:hypothetical protein [Algoriphagus boseongensis]TDQ19653.1 hypothetical protein DFQ04_1477 [Algoriphagus boseongensis]